MYAGSSDYMTTHEFPFQEIEIERKMTKHDIIELVKYTYHSICDSMYEQLDVIPV
jgi:hypothetical protein